MTTSKLTRYDQERAERDKRNSDALLDAAINGQLDNHYANKFRQYFPSNIEHCLRMAQEQLQSGLKSRSITASEIAQLSSSVNNLYQVYRNL